MIGSDVIRGYSDTILLSLLAEGDSYGYEISKAIRERSGGAYVMKETTLYSAFARLEKNGFIAAYQGVESRGRPRTYYTITAPGREYLAAKLEEWRETRALMDCFCQLRKEPGAPEDHEDTGASVPQKTARPTAEKH